MRRLLVALNLLAATLWSPPAVAQARNQLGPLCTTDTTPADKMIDACNRIIALKVFRAEQLATIGANESRHRCDVRSRHADRVRDRAGPGRARRRRRQLAILRRALPPPWHAGARSAADADPGAGRGGLGQEEQNRCPRRTRRCWARSIWRRSKGELARGPSEQCCSPTLSCHRPGDPVLRDVSD